MWGIVLWCKLFDHQRFHKHLMIFHKLILAIPQRPRACEVVQCRSHDIAKSCHRRSGNNKLTGETVLLLLSSLMKPLIADHLTFLAKWFVNIQAGTMFPGLSVVSCLGSGTDGQFESVYSWRHIWDICFANASNKHTRALPSIGDSDPWNIVNSTPVEEPIQTYSKPRMPGASGPGGPVWLGTEAGGEARSLRGQRCHWLWRSCGETVSPNYKSPWNCFAKLRPTCSGRKRVVIEL